MNEKQLLFGNDARTPILEGARKVAKAVISTLGPMGRNVVIRKGPMRSPTVTKDGVTVAKEIKAFPDFYEDIGLQFVKESASRTNDAAGDGTTTATLLTYEMMNEGLKHLVKGTNSIHLRRGMQMAVKAVTKKLEELSQKVTTPEQFKSIATISSQDEEIGALVTLVHSEVGEDGAITVEPAQSLGVSYALTEGMQLMSGFITEHFVNRRDKRVCMFDDPYILVTDERITSIDQVLPVIELMIKNKQQIAPLVIIAESVEHEALNTLVLNLPQVSVKGADPSQKSNFISLAIRAPGIGDQRNAVLQDIAAKTGARIITKTVGLNLQSVVLEDLGRAERIIATATTTTIVNGQGNDEAVQNRVTQLKQEIETAEANEDKDFLNGRLANLNGKIGVIRVGASSEVEQKEKQHRVEDAVAAVRAAASEGIVAGGGTVFIQCMDSIDLEQKGLTEGELIGMTIVKEILKKPLWWIADNGGYSADDVVTKVMDICKEGKGFNAETGEYVDMIDSHIIDPKKVSRCALENAVSIAGSFLTLEVAVTDLYSEIINE